MAKQVKTETFKICDCQKVLTIVRYLLYYFMYRRKMMFYKYLRYLLMFSPDIKFFLRKQFLELIELAIVEGIWKINSLWNICCPCCPVKKPVSKWLGISWVIAEQTNNQTHMHTHRFYSFIKMHRYHVHTTAGYLVTPRAVSNKATLGIVKVSFF